MASSVTSLGPQLGYLEDLGLVGALSLSLPTSLQVACSWHAWTSHSMAVSGE